MQAYKTLIPEFDPLRLAVVGISHREATLAIREKFVLNTESRHRLYPVLHHAGLPFCMILSTCNRTEIYTDVAHIEAAVEFWFYENSIPSDAQNLLFNLNGHRAVKHLFSVVSGTESQIPGDMQITQQVIQAFEEARNASLAHGLFEKLINQALYCGKRVKSETKLSSGISSVPSAVTMLVRKYLQPHDRVVILGVGNVGKISCRNLIKTIPAEHITVINRTENKSVELAQALGVNTVPYEAKDEAIINADILIVSTSAHAPVITKDLLTSGRRKIILDLSMPSGVAPDVASVNGVTVLNLDSISRLLESHIGEREAELTNAADIISNEIQSSDQWWRRRAVYLRNAPHIQLNQRLRKHA